MTALLHQHEHTDVKLISLKNMFSFVSCEYGRPQEFDRLGNFFEIWEAELWGGHYPRLALQLCLQGKSPLETKCRLRLPGHFQLSRELLVFCPTSPLK